MNETARLNTQIVINAHICHEGYKRATQQKRVDIPSLPREGILFKVGNERIRFCLGDLLTIDWTFNIGKLE